MLTTTFVNRNCDTECTLNDAGQSKCLQTGNWAEPLPTCISKTLKIHYVHAIAIITSCAVVDCGDPGVPSNGNTMVTNTVYSSIVNHTCNAGYALNGANQRKCLASGNWLKPLPFCESKYIAM